MRKIRRQSVLLALWTLLLAGPRTADAQLKGHYVPGFTGLQNGSQGPPALTVVLPIYFYTTDTINDADGNELGSHPRINSAFLGPGLVWVTETKLLGGRLGGQVLPLAFMSARIEGPSIDVPGGLKFTDVFVQPLQLGWEKPRADFVAGWGFFAPTGSWKPGATDNGGLGMWSNVFQAGTTLRLDARRAWTASTLASYEIHSDKKDTNLKVGDILTLEGGLGKSFYQKVDGTPLPRITTVGLAYYGQFKVTRDTVGPEVLSINLDRDRVFGLGVESSVFLPKQKLLLGLRVVPEFGAASRTRGLTFDLTLAYQMKSLAKANP